MKKLIAFLLIFFSCGDSEAVKEPVITTTTIEVINTTSTTIFINSEEFQNDLEEYRQGWVSQLLSYPLLTEEEYKISINYVESIYPGSTINLKIEGKDYSCVDKNSGMVINRFANEVHPIDLYEEGKEAASNLGYAVSLDYNCTQLNDGSYFPLYGPLFYQDNQWWGFQESNNDYWRNYEKDIEILAFMTKFSERVSLAGSLNDEFSAAISALGSTSIFNCEPDPTVPECLYEYNPTTELFWSSASMFYANQYEKLWNLYVERYRNKDIEVPTEIANIFDQPVFTIEVDGKTLNCFYHLPHNSQYWRTDGIYPQPLETVTEDENYLVWPKIYWDCLDVPLSLWYGNYSTDDNWNLINTDVMYFGQGPIVLLGDIGNRDPDFRYGTWVMWGPEQPFGENSSDEPRQFEVRDKYWWYEDGFSVESFCEETTFTYQEDYEILCLND